MSGSTSPTPCAYMGDPIDHLATGNLFIGISGLIGAGKSTLATALAKEMNLPPMYEPVDDNVYLADFYLDQAKYSFHMQVFLLNKRFRQHQQIIWEGKGAVQDRTIYEDSVFAKMLRDSGLMEERDYLTYVDLFQNMSNFMKKPNLIVHLDVTPEESVERIKRRNRSCECGIPLEYLQNLHSAYETFITNISRTIPVIKVNWNTFQTAEDMAKMVRLEYLKMENIRSVSFNQPWPKPMASLSNAAAASDDTAKAEIGSQEAELVAAAGAIKIDGA